jgi:hypothetical protein
MIPYCVTAFENWCYLTAKQNQDEEDDETYCELQEYKGNEAEDTKAD